MKLAPLLEAELALTVLLGAPCTLLIQQRSMASCVIFLAAFC
jgi:hypothetical protein